MELLLNKETVKNCIGWQFNPLVQVESLGDLETTPKGSDSASKPGCKSQSYTSWNCLSRSYVGGTVITQMQNAPVQLVVPPERLSGDQPTPAELTAMDATDREALKSGSMIFIRGEGVFTKKMAETVILRQMEHLRATIAADNPPQVPSPGRCTRQAGPAEAQDPPNPIPDQNVGFFYSDSIPVRSALVSDCALVNACVPTPYSSVGQALAGMLNDPSHTVLDADIWDARTMSLLYLIKSINMLEPVIVLEIAPMVRALAQVLSVADESYKLDPITYRFVRKMSSNIPMGMKIIQKPGFEPGEWKLVAMPLNTFVAPFWPNSYNNFTAVPVSSQLLGQSCLLPYIASFLSSDLWSGTTNYYRRTERTGPNNSRYSMTETYLPVVNNVDIPGPQCAALVLIDETDETSPNNIRVSVGAHAVDVPVWKGHDVVVPVPFGDLWGEYWSTNRIECIRSNSLLAYNEICTRLGVSNACGTALSLVSEFYGIWYNGIALDTQAHQIKPDFDKPAYGAWTYDGSALDETGTIKSGVFNLNQADKIDARRRSVAYNFSGITPLHLGPSGSVKIRYINEDGLIRISWSTQQPKTVMYSYKMSTMSSIVRIATAVGLISTESPIRSFTSPRELTHWLHMLSCALSFSMSSFLTINNLSPRVWGGFDDRYDAICKESELEFLFDLLYQNRINSRDMQSFYNYVGGMDISEYWGMSACNNVNWLTFSPVPFHCTWQWIQKMGLIGGVPPSGDTHFKFNDKIHMELKITDENLEHKCNAPATIDAYRRFPQIVVTEEDGNRKYIFHWIDSVSAYSIAASGGRNVLHAWDMYESMTFCAPSSNFITKRSYSSNSWYVVGSNYECNDENFQMPVMSRIQWPHAPVLETLWTGAKNYIRKLQKLGSDYRLAQRLAGAAIAEATHVAHQIATDLAIIE